MTDSACHRCVHFQTDADSDYYEGLCDFSFACLKNHYRIDEPYEFRETADIRAALAHGDNCPDYEATT